MFEYRRDFNHARQVAPRVRVAQSNIQVQISVIRHFPSVHWHCWLADKKGIWPATTQPVNGSWMYHRVGHQPSRQPTCLVCKLVAEYTTVSDTHQMHTARTGRQNSCLTASPCCMQLAAAPTQLLTSSISSNSHQRIFTFSGCQTLWYTRQRACRPTWQANWLTRGLVTHSAVRPGAFHRLRGSRPDTLLVGQSTVSTHWREMPH